MGSEFVVVLLLQLLNPAPCISAAVSHSGCPDSVAAAKDVWTLREAAAALGGTAEIAACQLLATNRYPEEFVVWFDAGQMYQSTGDMEQSKVSYERAIEIKPDFVHAMNNLGAVYKELGMNSKARKTLLRGIELDPGFAGLEYNLGMLCAKLQKLKCAMKHLQAAIKKSKPPEPMPRWHNDLAAVLEGSGRLAEALHAAEQAVSLEPGAAKFVARRDRVKASLAANDGADPGVDTWRAALIEAQRQEAAGHVDDAYDSFQELADADPSNAEVHYMMAWNRFKAEDFFPAHTHLTEAIEISPENVDYIEFMGVLLHETGNWEEAIAYLERAVETGAAHPNTDAKTHGKIDHETWFNLGVVYKDLEKNQMSANSFSMAYELCIDLPNSKSRKEMHETKMKYLALAVEHANKACDWKTFISLWPTFEKHLQAADKVALGSADPYDVILHTETPAIAVKVAQQYIQKINGTIVDADEPPLVRYDSWLHMAARLRIGVLSADLRKHPVTQTLRGTIDALRVAGGESVSVIAFSTCPDKPEDATQQAIRAEFDDWQSLFESSDAEAAAVIAEAGVHILIDLQGHTLHRRPGIVLRRPAPLILSMQGFAASTGIAASTLSYLVADRVVFPPEIAAAPDSRTEHLLYMPYSFFGCGYAHSLAAVAQRPRDPPNVLAEAQREQPAKSWVDEEDEFEARLQDTKLRSLVQQLDLFLHDHATHKLDAPSGLLMGFGLRRVLAPAILETTGGGGFQPMKKRMQLCANIRASKVDRKLFTMWANVLRLLPSAELILDGRHEDAVANLQAEGSARGLDPTHFRAPWEADFEQYLRRSESCAAFLDGMSYSAHTVGADALFMGTPLITVAGGKMANRVGASLMTAAGLGLHVSASAKAYEDDAVEHMRWLQRDLASGAGGGGADGGGGGGAAPSAARVGRPRMPRASRDSPLFDTSRWGEGLLGGLRTAWDRLGRPDAGGGVGSLDFDSAPA